MGDGGIGHEDEEIIDPFATAKSIVLPMTPSNEILKVMVRINGNGGQT